MKFIARKKPDGYKELLVYKRAEELQDFIYKNYKNFPITERRRREHMRDSARSVKQNIVEGWKRETTWQYIDFLSFSFGSLGELKEDGEDCIKRSLISLQESEGLMRKCGEIDFLMRRLKNALERKMAGGGRFTKQETDEIKEFDEKLKKIVEGARDKRDKREKRGERGDERSEGTIEKELSGKRVGINVDILVVKESKILLGLLTNKWNYQGEQVYGVPGRDIRFGEKIGDTIKRNIKEEFACNLTKYKIICVNANYALGNHYIGIGVIVEIDGEPKILIPEDWEKWEWFNKDKIPHNLFPAARNLIRCYLENKFIVTE